MKSIIRQSFNRNYAYRLKNKQGVWEHKQKSVIVDNGYLFRWKGDKPARLASAWYWFKEIILRQILFVKTQSQATYVNLGDLEKEPVNLK